MMCVACKEFIKDRLTFSEFKNALWEMTREDEGHLAEIEALLRKPGASPDLLRQKLAEKTAGPSRD